jgi:CBS domain-containing protein
MPLKVEDVMVQSVITVNANVTVKRAVSIMNKNEIGCLIGVKQGKAVGIVTERAMLTRVLAEACDPERTKVSEIMSSPLIAVDPKMDIENAAKFMFKMRVKKLPVVSNSKLVGLITLTDIARFQPKIIKTLKSARDSQMSKLTP